MMAQFMAESLNPSKQDGTTPAQSSWTIGRLLEWTTDYLRRQAVDAPRLASELLLAHTLGCKKIDLYTRYAEQPSAERLSAFREAIRRAAQRFPIAYLTGAKEFYSLEFEVTPAVLIPRPETEVLVDQVIAHCRSATQERIDILDFGTGSGCIGLTLCHQLPQVHVVGSDISSESLAVAARNARRLSLADRFRIVQADGLSLPAEVVPRGGFDLLVSNPPYVATDAAASLSAEVRDYEPQVALLAGPDGLDFYRRIAAGAADILKQSASIFLEMGYDQHQRVVEIFTAGGFEHVATWRDFNEGHPRVIRFDRCQ